MGARPPTHPVLCCRPHWDATGHATGTPTGPGLPEDTPTPTPSSHMDGIQAVTGVPWGPRYGTISPRGAKGGGQRGGHSSAPAALGAAVGWVALCPIVPLPAHPEAGPGGAQRGSAVPPPKPHGQPGAALKVSPVAGGQRPAATSSVLGSGADTCGRGTVPARHAALRGTASLRVILPLHVTTPLCHCVPTGHPS